MAEKSDFSKPHQYAMTFPKPPASTNVPILYVVAKPKQKMNPAIPGQKFKTMGGRVQRITNDANLVEKGRPATEYKSPSGWTTINNPLANRFLPAPFVPKPPSAAKPGLYRSRERRATQYDHLNLDDDYDAEEEYEESSSAASGVYIADSDSACPELQMRNKPRVASTVALAGLDLGTIDGLDLASVLKKDKAKFSKSQEIAMARFILANKTQLVIKHKAEFNALLRYMGFLDEKLQPELLAALRTKVRGRLQTIKDGMVKAEALRENRDVNGKLELTFAFWTEGWENEDWDGSYAGPQSVG